MVLETSSQDPGKDLRNEQLPGEDLTLLDETRASTSCRVRGWSSLCGDHGLRYSLRFRRLMTQKTSCIVFSAFLLFVLYFFVHPVWPTSHRELDVLDYIDPMIGTRGDGHVFAGATLPFGMAKPVADVIGDAFGGFVSGSAPVAGFSHLHDSGTGGAPSLGNFPIFLHAHCPDIDQCPLWKSRRAKHYDPTSIESSPGYFSIALDSGVRAEMTASYHVALYRFAVTHQNHSAVQPVLLADTSDLPTSGGARSIYIDPQGGRISGEGTFAPSFGQGTYRAYFCADIRGADVEAFGTFDEAVHFNKSQSHSDNPALAPEMGAFIRFGNVTSDDQIVVRVGLSWLSMERACQNGAEEVADWNFERLRKEAQHAWRRKLSPVSVSTNGINDSLLRNFWSGIYRAFMSPQDYTGENQLWDSDEPYYDSWYCIWDTFRSLHPFLTLVDPGSQSRMVRSLVDIYQHVGWLPDCRMSFCKGFTQGGSNADVVIADAFVKGIPDVNWDLAYKAMIKDAEKQPVNWDLEGRGDLSRWKQLGYVPASGRTRGLRTRSISRTVEYAYNDFCIAQVANATGRQQDFELYADRASNWKNIYKDDHESMGFKGFVQPRFADGEWGFQNATLCSRLNDFDGCYLVPDGHETYEGSPWLYTLYVPGDMAGLIAKVGGPGTFVSRLETLHESGLLYIGDEQAFLTPFLYHYAGRPGLSSKRIHTFIPRIFNDTNAGIPGNDDSGAMGTFVALSMLGIFPNAGQNVYFITPPFFPEVNITNPYTSKTATIRNINFDPTYRNIFIQHATLDGVPYSRNWIDHRFFLEGGILELNLGNKESVWGTQDDDLPPSLSNHGAGLQ